MKNDFEWLAALLESDRSVRRFDGSAGVPATVLEKIVGLVRYCASARNAQPLRYRLVADDNEKEALFPLLGWAGYYEDWDGPEPEQRPGGYIVQLLDTTLASSCGCDDGLHLQAMTLGAATLGLGCCIIKSFNVVATSEILGLGQSLRPLHVLALGRPAECVRITEMPSDGNFRYFRDDKDCQCVPKRSLSDIIVR